jgi:hypothetical protein
MAAIPDGSVRQSWAWIKSNSFSSQFRGDNRIFEISSSKADRIGPRNRSSPSYFWQSLCAPILPSWQVIRIPRDLCKGRS